MLNEARALIVRYVKNAARAITSEPRCTAASDEKNWSIASKKERNESPTASVERTTIRLCGGHAQHYGKRRVRAAPVARHELAIAADDPAQHQRHEDRVVELARHGDEVGHEVDRQGEVSG